MNAPGTTKSQVYVDTTGRLIEALREKRSFFAFLLRFRVALARDNRRAGREPVGESCLLGRRWGLDAVVKLANQFLGGF